MNIKETFLCVCDDGNDHFLFIQAGVRAKIAYHTRLTTNVCVFRLPDSVSLRLLFVFFSYSFALIGVCRFIVSLSYIHSLLSL